MKPAVQEVVKVDLIDSIPEAKQNVSFSQNSSNSNLAAELQIGNITLRLFNGADKHLIQNTLRCIGRYESCLVISQLQQISLL